MFQVIYRDGVYWVLSDYFQNDLVLNDHPDFDCNYDCYQSDWRDIETPYYQKLLSDQGIGEWYYALVGRTFHPLGRKDHWNILPILVGSKNCGKFTSTLKGPLLKDNISGYQTKNYTLSTLSNDFTVKRSNAPMLTYESGNKCREIIINDESMIVIGTEFQEMNLDYRIVLIPFNNTIESPDHDLQQKIEQELPKLVVKCNKAYFEYSEKFINKFPEDF